LLCTHRISIFLISLVRISSGSGFLKFSASDNGIIAGLADRRIGVRNCRLKVSGWGWFKVFPRTEAGAIWPFGRVEWRRLQCLEWRKRHM